MKLKQALGAALLLGLTVPMLSYAEPMSEVVITLSEPTKASVDPLTPDVPRLHQDDATANDMVRFKIVNSTGKHMTLTAPELQIQGNSFLVPANTTREVIVPKSAVGYETHKVTYNVDRIPDPTPPGPQFEDWKNRLSALVAAQRPDYSYFPQYQFNK